MSTTLIFQLQSIIIVILMLYGFFVRRNRYKHIKTMKLVITWDIILILQIELSRGAIIKASNALTNAIILNIHVSLAVGTVLLYGLILYTGNRLKNGDESIRKFHRPIGYLTLTTRVATLITSFFIVE